MWEGGPSANVVGMILRSIKDDEGSPDPLSRARNKSRKALLSGFRMHAAIVSVAVSFGYEQSSVKMRWSSRNHDPARWGIH